MTDKEIINSTNSQKISVYCKTCVCRGCHTGQELYNQGMWHGMAIGSKEELDRLKAENERLKEKILKFRWDNPYFDLYNNVVSQRDMWEQKSKQYKSCLQKIKAIANTRFVNGLNEEADIYNAEMDRILDLYNVLKRNVEVLEKVERLLKQRSVNR